MTNELWHSREFAPPFGMLARVLAAILALASLANAESPATPLADALQTKRVAITATGNGRDTLHVQASASEKVHVSIPAGAQFRATSGEAQIVLRETRLDPGPGSDFEAIIPAAALRSANSGEHRSLEFTSAREPRLAKLIELFAAQNDLPRPTAQLAVFIALEDLSWPAWKQWLAPAWKNETPAKPHPTPAEVAQAVDAIAFCRLAMPEQKFAILQDEDFKRLALRNPWARGKAMALYGLTVEDALTGDSSLPVDLGKLLHTSPNDNCPICRRAKGPVEIP